LSATLTPDTPLSDAIEAIKNSIEPPLKIVVRWKDLEDNAGIEREMAIGMQGLDGIPVGKALKELLDSISGGVTKIDYVVDDGIITVATKESLPTKLITQIYDITDLTSTAANYTSELATQEDVSSVQSTDTTSPEQQKEERKQLADTIVQTIQDAIEPTSWVINGGEGAISANFAGTKITVSQTPQIHELIQKHLMESRELLGHQVSIEARFLFVTENFLEDIGLDMTMNIPGTGKFGNMTFNQGSYDYSKPTTTGISGNLADSVATSPGIDLTSGLTYGQTALVDQLSLSFFLRATQAHRDAKMLTAPRVTVLSGENATIKIAKEISYVSDYDFQDITGAGIDQPTRVVADPTTETEAGGVTLNILPTISADKKYVILDIRANYTKLNFHPFTVSSSTTGQGFPIQLPEREIAEVKTRVSVPDSGTLLIGGQKLGGEINKESGVPGLSKAPLIGRFFSNRSKVKDQDILLILVKPSIILQEEAEREYFAPLE
jgi:type II secretory pathway component GspD/PulD (secretin)